jgi:hypothetical protein
MSKRFSIWFWLAAIAILIAGSFFYFKQDLSKPSGQSVLKPLIRDQFKKMILEASDSLYQVRFKQFDFNIDAGKALITGFELVPDTGVFNRLVKQRRAPNYLLYYKADSVRLTDFGFKKQDSVTRFNVSKIWIKSPLITVRTKFRAQHADDTTWKEKLFFKLSHKIFKRMQADEIIMPNTNFLLVNNNRETERKTRIKANIVIKGFSTKPGVKGGVDINIAEYKHSPDSMYDIRFNKIRLSTDERLATIAHVSVTPRLSKERYYKAVGFDKDRYQFELDRITMANVNTARFLTRQELCIGTYTVNDVWAEVFKNYNWPKKKFTSRRNTYPNEKLRLLAIDVKIDTMRIRHGTFHHTIFPKKSRQTARLSLYGISGVYTNVTNIPRDIAAHPYATVITSCRLMNAAPMYLKIVFNLSKPSAPFTYYSNLTGLNGAALNPLLKPLGMMEIKSGTINKMTMTLAGDEYQAKGKIDLYYHNLKINMLKRDKEAGTLKNMGIVSFLTNAVLPNDNPGGNGKLRPGPINRIRGERETFFGFIWYCMLDGSTSAVMGYDKKKKKPNENILLKIGETIAGPKDQ